MDFELQHKRRKQLLTSLAIACVIVVAGGILLPMLFEKLLLAAVMALIIGALFFTNDTGRYICKRILLALLTVFIIALITFFAMNAMGCRSRTARTTAPHRQRTMRSASASTPSRRL